MKDPIEAALRRRKKRKSYARVRAGALALAVLLSGWAMWHFRGKGEALTGEPTCGLAEHIHGERCYNRHLICPLAEGEDHTHGEACWAAGELVCEDGSHTHEAGCYAREKLTCGENHSHTRSCYKELTICGIPVHTHSEGCYAASNSDSPSGEVSLRSNRHFNGYGILRRPLRLPRNDSPNSQALKNFRFVLTKPREAGILSVSKN